MSHLTTNDTATRELLERMIAARQLSPLDAQAFAKLGAVAVNASEDAVLRWLAKEYDVSFTALDAVDHGKRRRTSPRNRCAQCSRFESGNLCIDKTWNQRRTRRLSDAVVNRAAKQRKITQSALAYLKRRGWLERRARFDVISVLWSHEVSEPQIRHYVNAFDSTGFGQMYS